MFCACALPGCAGYFVVLLCASPMASKSLRQNQGSPGWRSGFTRNNGADGAAAEWATIELTHKRLGRRAGRITSGSPDTAPWYQSLEIPALEALLLLSARAQTSLGSARPLIIKKPAQLLRCRRRVKCAMKRLMHRNKVSTRSPHRPGTATTSHQNLLREPSSS